MNTHKIIALAEKIKQSNAYEILIAHLRGTLTDDLAKTIVKTAGITLTKKGAHQEFDVKRTPPFIALSTSQKHYNFMTRNGINIDPTSLQEIEYVTHESKTVLHVETLKLQEFTTYTFQGRNRENTFSVTLNGLTTPLLSPPELKFRPPLPEPRPATEADCKTLLSLTTYHKFAQMIQDMAVPPGEVYELGLKLFPDQVKVVPLGIRYVLSELAKAKQPISLFVNNTVTLQTISGQLIDVAHQRHVDAKHRDCTVATLLSYTDPKTGKITYVPSHDADEDAPEMGHLTSLHQTLTIDDETNLTHKAYCVTLLTPASEDKPESSKTKIVLIDTTTNQEVITIHTLNKRPGTSDQDCLPQKEGHSVWLDVLSGLTQMR